MKAAVVGRAGQVPEYADFPDPEVDGEHAVVELVAAGIHQIVRSRVDGRHYSAEGAWPAIPGVDAVARTPDGRLVYTGFVDPPWGTMAERMAVPAPFGLPLPEGADPLAIAAGLNPGLASWLPLARRRDEIAGAGAGADADARAPHGMGDGDDGADHPRPAPAGLGTVLVLGATGVSGGMAVDNAFALGATAVVAVGRNADRLAALAERVGNAALADRVGNAALTDRVGNAALRTVRLESDRRRTGDAIADALGGRAPSTVIDFCWGPVAEAAFHALGRADLEAGDGDAGVHYFEVGGTAGPEAALPAALLRSRRITITGSGLGGSPLSEVMMRLPQFAGMIASGTVHVPYTAYPLSEVAAAWVADDGTRAVLVPG